MNLEDDHIDLKKIMFSALIRQFNKKTKFLNMIQEIELIVEEEEIEIYKEFDPFGTIPPQIISIPRLLIQIQRIINLQGKQ